VTEAAIVSTTNTREKVIPRRLEERSQLAAATLEDLMETAGKSYLRVVPAEVDVVIADSRADKS